MTGQGHIARRSRALFLFWVILAASGCAPARKANVDLAPEQWSAALGARGVDPTAIDNPIAFTPEMQSAAERWTRGSIPEQRLRSLQTALFDERGFPFAYDERGTFTAIQAFRLRRGNCVSFTNLFIALSRSLGIPVRAAFVYGGGDTEKDGELVIVNDHVVAVLETANRFILFDFSRNRQRRVPRYHLVDDLWIAAMYANNLGVDALRNGDLESATRLMEAAVRLAPEFVGPLTNLGVLRRAAGDNEGALDAYRRALEISPRDPEVLNNLAVLYRETGRRQEARAAVLAANVREARSPYPLLVRGNLELAEGRVVPAIRLFRRARRLSPDLPDPLIAIARAEMHRGRERAARKALERAIEIDPANVLARTRLRSLGAGGGGSEPGE